MRTASVISALISAALLSACSSLAGRQETASTLVQSAGWQWQNVPVGNFTVATALSPAIPSSRLVVYLEGDGFAFVRPSQPSQDPTPTDPVALRLALAHPRQGPHSGQGVNVAWIARPCQYVRSAACGVTYWTLGRYSAEIIDSVGLAVDRVKAARGATEVVLVGYSGGGAIAALLAARRDDVHGLVTVAAPLDLGFWTSLRGVSPLSASLDPAQDAARLGGVPQTHFSGAQDHVVGTQVTRSFMARLPITAQADLREIPGFDHQCCWARDWRNLVGADW